MIKSDYINDKRPRSNNWIWYIAALVVFLGLPALMVGAL